MKYYNPEKILAMKDLDKEEPSIYLISSNRSAGKTTAFLIKALKHHKETGRKFALLYRYQYELNSAEKIFADVMNIYPELSGELTTVAHAKGLMYEIFMDKKSMCYALSLNNPDALKKYSPMFSTVDFIIFDEFQTETGKYLPKETEKFMSLMITVARGGGEQHRNIKVFMLSNKVSIMNPYFITFGIHKRIKKDTKFIRGHGWVAEFNHNEDASNSISKSGIAKAFSNSDYIKYSTQNDYLIQCDSFIEKMSGRSKYLFTIQHDGVSYGVREFMDDGIIHVSKKVDGSCQYIAVFKASDHTQNTMMLNHFSFLFKNLKDAFNNGHLRFDDVGTKNVIFDILAIDIYK